MGLIRRDGILITVEAALTSDPLDSSPTWTDVTTGFRSARIRRGRSHELDRMQPGVASMIFKNADDRWNSWNTGGPYYNSGASLVPMRKMRLKAQWNLLSANQSSLETDTTGWAAGTNTTISRSLATPALDGVASLKLLSTAAGTVAATTPNGASGVAVTAGKTYTATASFRSGGAGSRTGTVQIQWFKSNGTASSVRAVDTGAATSTLLLASWAAGYVTAVAPSDAAYAAIVVVVSTPSAGSEDHYVDRVGLFCGATTTTWSLGDPYYLFTGYIESIEQSWPNKRYAETTVTLTDGFKVLSLAKAAKTTFYDAIAAKTPAGYWRLDDKGEASAVNGLITATDASGNSRDGTYKGSPGGYVQPGALPAEVGGASDLGNREGWIEVPSSAIAAGTGNFSVVAWVKPRSFNQTTPVDRIWHVAGVGGQSLYVVIFSDGTVGFTASDSTNGGSLDSGSNALTIGEWNLVVVVKSGTTGPGNWAIYINGTDVSNHAGETVVGSGNFSATANSTLLGGYETGGVGQGALDGLLDEVAFIRSALSSGDVTTLHNASYGLSNPALSGTRIGKLLDVAGIPTGDRSLDSGQFTMQPIKNQLYNNSPLPLILDYVDSEGYPAAFFFAGNGNAIFYDNDHATPSSSATFGDGGGELDPRAGAAAFSPPTLDDADLWSTVVCQADGGTPQVASDGTAVTRYVDRTLSRTGLKNADDADVATLASALLARYKAPALRIKALTIHPVGDPGNLWPHALGREIGDRIGYNRHTLPGGGTALTMDLRIESIAHAIEPADWHTTWMAVPT